MTDLSDFNWKYYVLNYEDLRNNNINNENKAKEHWLKYGKKEGRIANRLFYFFDSYLDNKINFNEKKTKQIYNIKEDEYICIKPYGGLCNYLRVIFSYLKYAQTKKKKLIVIWEVTQYCNGFFLDYFDSIQDLYFIKYEGLLGYIKLYQNLKIDYIGNLWHPSYSPNICTDYLYSELKIREEYHELVDRFLKRNDNYISVHIRRTDHVLCNIKSTTDESFIYFIEENLKNNSKLTVYVATDNRLTQKKFKDLFPNDVVFHSEIKRSSKLRKTNLEQALIDLYLCVYSSKFKGSYYSSFSELIEEIRNNNKKIKY